MSEALGKLMAHCGTTKITRDQLKELPLPEATRTHQPIAHHRIIDALVESLSFRHISVVRDEYALSPDSMRMFGVLDLETGLPELATEGIRFSIGIRNSNDKSLRLAMTIGYRVFVCDNMAFKGDFSPIFHKHTAKLDLLDVISVGVDKMQRNFAPLKRQIQMWQVCELSDEQAKLIIYRAFVEEGYPRQLIQKTHDHYFIPKHEAFLPRTLWSLSNAFTSAFKELSALKQFQISAKLGGFMQRQGSDLQAQSLNGACNSPELMSVA